MQPKDPPPTNSREQLRRQYQEQLSRYKSANADLADTSWTLSELEQQISTLEAELAQSGDERIAHRLRDLRRWRDSLEETVLRYMYRTDEISAEIAQLRSALES
jgi:septal ring factor EnvC (AmiA/AmiB activator)